MKPLRCDDFSLGRPVLVGWSNPHSADPRDALSVDPPKGSGARLFRLSGLTFEEYVDGFAKVNVEDTLTFSRYNLFCTATTVTIVFGIKAAARQFPLLKGCPWFYPVIDDDYGTTYLAPHPGGVNRLYNSEEHRNSLRKLMRELFWTGRSRNDY